MRFLKRTVLAALLLFSVPVLVGGCGTIAATRGSWPDPLFYGGTQFDVGNIVYGSRSGLGHAFGVVDLPLSLVADTIILPLNIRLWLHPRSRGRTWIGRDRGYWVGNGFKAYEEVRNPDNPDESWTTQWEYDGTVKAQHRILYHKDSVVPLDSEHKYSPPWWWGVHDQTEPSAPWWSEGATTEENP